MSEFFTKLKVDSFLVIPLAVILISFFLVLIPNTTKAEFIFYEENFDFYSDGYSILDIPNWSTYHSLPTSAAIVSSDYYKSSPFSLKIHYDTWSNYQEYTFNSPYYDNFTFSFDFLATDLVSSELFISFLDDEGEQIAGGIFQTTKILDDFGGSILTWYNIKIEISFETYKYRTGVNSYWNDWNDFLSVPQQGIDNIKKFGFNYKYSSDKTTNFYVDNIKISSGVPEVPSVWDNFCGDDAGTIRDNAPLYLCDRGNPSTVIFDGIKWQWDCVDWTVSQSCRAYLTTTYPINGNCGIWNGLNFDDWPPLDDLCEIRASLVMPTMVETVDGWSWTCSGINGGSSAYCYAGKTTPAIFPEVPSEEIDDCSDMPLLEGLVCNLGNIIKSIFLPSAEKIDQLNSTINKMSGKFPFSYISIAQDTIDNIESGINENSTLELSIMGSEKSGIDVKSLPFVDLIKTFSSLLIVMLFIFWLIKFIKDIF